MQNCFKILSQTEKIQFLNGYRVSSVTNSIANILAGGTKFSTGIMQNFNKQPY